MCGKLSSSVGGFGGYDRTRTAERYVCSPAGPSGGHCHGISPFVEGDGSAAVADLLHRYEHVFPAPVEPITGRTTSVQNEILTSDARPVRCGPRRLAPAGLRTETTCVQNMLAGGQIEPSDSPWASPVVLVTKKDGSTCFCVDYCWLNSLTTKDA